MKRCIGDDRLVTDLEIPEALTHREIMDYIERECRPSGRRAEMNLYRVE